MLKVQEFIYSNPLTWKETLSQKPFCLSIKEESTPVSKFYILSYNQIESDFSLPIVQECRGLILEETFEVIEFNPFPWIEGGHVTHVHYTPVCIPFYKFFNYGESNAATIDWNSAKVQEKVDGSIIKLWFSQTLSKWVVSTNGTIFAIFTDLPSNVGSFKTFGDLFWSLIDEKLVLTLNENYTFFFELVSPYNRVVVPYPESKLFHIGTRDNLTLKELDVNIGIKKPKVYPMKTLEECINIAKELPFSEEGYVVVDDNYNRIKIKSPNWLLASRLVNNHIVTYKRILDLVRTGEHVEFLSYFPEYSEQFQKVVNLLSTFVDKISSEKDVFLLLIGKFETRKDMALWVQKQSNPTYFFQLYDNWNLTVTEYLSKVPSEKILSWIGLNENL